MTSAICVNFDQSKNLSSGNELNQLNSILHRTPHLYVDLRALDVTEI